MVVGEYLILLIVILILLDRFLGNKED